MCTYSVVWDVCGCTNSHLGVVWMGGGGECGSADVFVCVYVMDCGGERDFAQMCMFV